MGKVIGTIGKALISPVATLIGAFDSKPAPPPVEEKGPVVMPLADGEAVQRARRRSITTQSQRGGRSSTMLTSDSDKLGG